MPLYEFECSQCGITERIYKTYECPFKIVCPQCRMCYARKIISRPAAMKPDWAEYWDENLSDEPVLVRGRGHRKELMKVNDLVECDMSSQRKKEVKQKLEHIKHNPKDLNKLRKVQKLDKGV